ncbi:MAG: CoxG family protein [Anaerolineae bacterium]
MIIEDRFVIPVPIQQVWDFFLDIPGVSKCIPGVEKVEQADGQTFTGSLGVRVGPIAANFEGKVVLAELEPLHRLVVRAEGKDRSTASMVSGTMTATLSETAPGQTEVAYQIDVAIRGRLGQFGQAVIVETAKQISRAFAACVQAQLADQAALPFDRAQDERQSSGQAPPSATHEAQSPESPSVLSIVLSALLASMVNGLRSLRAGIASRLGPSG